MEKQDKLSYGESRNNNMVKCDDIYYLYIGQEGWGIDGSNDGPVYFPALKWQNAYWGDSFGANGEGKFVGIARKGEEVALVQLLYKGNSYEPMRVKPEDARDASVRKEWLEDELGYLEWLKTEGGDFCGLDPETVNPNEIEMWTKIYKIGDRDYCEEYQDKVD